jgi:hypothetical protein
MFLDDVVLKWEREREKKKFRAELFGLYYIIFFNFVGK